MNLFELKDWVLTVQPQAWSLLPFKAILKRDKSRDKANALKEMLFVYYYTDIKSDYLIITDDKLRCEEIKKDIGLSDSWKLDSTIQEAVDFYNNRSLSVIGKLYKNALKATNDVSEYLYRTDELLEERDDRGKPINDISKITASIAKVRGLMQDLKSAEKEVVKESVELAGKQKGAKTYGLFEEGLNFDD